MRRPPSPPTGTSRPARLRIPTFRALPVAGLAALGLVALFVASVPHPARAVGEAPGDIGAAFAELTPGIRQATGYLKGTGAYVIDVLPGGPGDRKDLREGDIVIEFENEPVRSAAQLTGRIRRTGAGHLVSVRVFRDGGEEWLGLVTLAPRPVLQPLEDELIRLRLEVDRLWARSDSLEQRVQRLETGPPRRPKG